MTPPRQTWSKPEQSVGTQRESLDALGRRKCWNIRNESPAHLIWKEVSKAIMELLKDQYEHLDARGFELKIELFMIGRKPTKASPTILFSCESKICRQKAMELVDKRGILASHPGLLMAHSSRLPRLLALEGEVDRSQMLEGVYLNGPLKPCGFSVLVVREDYARPRSATIGGFVCVGGIQYGLTVGHAFTEPHSSAPIEENDLEFAFYGSSNLEDSSDEEETLEFITSEASVTSTSSPRGSATSSAGSTYSLSQKNLDIEGRAFLKEGNSIIQEPLIFKETASPIVGTLAASSSPLPFRIGKLHRTISPLTSLESAADWALIDFDMEAMQSLLSFLNVMATFTLSDILNNEMTLAGGKMCATMGDPNPSDPRVSVFFGSNGRIGSGILSGVSSFTLGSESNSWQETWTVTLDEGNFIDGDCGSWVIDSATGGFYGHVVAGYTNSSTAYLTSASNIFHDITKSLHLKINLPSHANITEVTPLATLENSQTDYGRMRTKSHDTSFYLRDQVSVIHSSHSEPDSFHWPSISAPRSANAATRKRSVSPTIGPLIEHHGKSKRSRRENSRRISVLEPRFDATYTCSVAQIINTLNTSRINTLTELRRIERIASRTPKEDFLPLQVSLVSSWTHYVTSHQMLNELRNLSRNYPFSSNLLDGAKSIVSMHLESEPTKNYARQVLEQIQDGQMIDTYSMTEAAKPEMWSGRCPDTIEVQQLAACFAWEWKAALDQMLQHWSDEPSRMTSFSDPEQTRTSDQPLCTLPGDTRSSSVSLGSSSSAAAVESTSIPSENTTHIQPEEYGLSARRGPSRGLNPRASQHDPYYARRRIFITLRNIPLTLKKEDLLQNMLNNGFPVPSTLEYLWQNGNFSGSARAEFSTLDAAAQISKVIKILGYQAEERTSHPDNGHRTRIASFQ